MPKMMYVVAWNVMLLMLMLKDASSVYITKLSVPRVYVLDNYHHHRHQHQQYLQAHHQNHHPSSPGHRTRGDGDPDIPFGVPAPQEPFSGSRSTEAGPSHHLVLDCEYFIEPDETGFVLKWLHNDVPIYQWIPPYRSPSSLNWMRDHVNRSFTRGTEAMHKHRALALMHPTPEFAGKYSCSVQTFQSGNIKSADLFIIVPESSFVLKYYRNLSDLVTVLCSVYGIFPAPELSLWVNDYRLENGSVNEIPVTGEGLFDSSISIQLVLYESLQADDVIKCVLTIPGTEYRRTKETVFVDTTSSNSRIFEESNSILDPFGMVSSTGGTKVLAPTALPTSSVIPTTTTTTVTMAKESSQRPTSAVLVVASPDGPARQPPSQVAQAIPSVIRLRPTASSTRVLTVQQSNAVDSDEIMNVLDFKEILNENLLYHNGAGTAVTLGLHAASWLRFAVIMVPSLLQIGWHTLRMLHS
ncbi:uncharacterized protein LOC126575647 [Anopheles aquasalis]|uniref:uncharacterized protein LOC126575647 n=1 Tax=Anopheles aquasalis TaxID=42839 RepID=UPI00215AD503|nr:uncharacterized protein LOC126575647 [Anopheles aquasalis]XP_050092409.1 uncharacterized protein LOC126575647 [Anopheles aquasalis]